LQNKEIKVMQLTKELKELYSEISPLIKKRLSEFKEIPKEKYFYELCFCVCTPQSKASSALAVQMKLEAANFYEKDIDVTPILRQKENYIRFHNVKAERLNYIKEIYPIIKVLIETPLDIITRRNKIKDLVPGFGYKESGHFLRNIGFEGVAILDRHILNCLVECGVFQEIPKIGSAKGYLDAEQKFIDFSKKVNIPIDELDLLFWHSKAGEIIK